MALLRFILILAGFTLVFTYRPLLYMAIGGAVIFVFMKTKEKKRTDKASEAGKKAENTEVPPQ